MHAFAQGLVSHTQGEGNDPHDSAVPACGLGESGADGPRIHIYIYMHTDKDPTETQTQDTHLIRVVKLGRHVQGLGLRA